MTTDRTTVAPDTGRAMQLGDASKGQTVRLVGMRAGCALRERLAAMGLMPNATITILRNIGRDQVIVRVKGTRILLGRGMADKILVEEV